MFVLQTGLGLIVEKMGGKHRKDGFQSYVVNINRVVGSNWQFRQSRRQKKSMFKSMWYLFSLF